ncbi:Radiation-resistant protein [Operophtera brumata]|uniref:Radiation-resistant protein n=1 Tax=Operophtera brumata TaxID=104452 RepID=A0A0L7LGL5_OPEBR|nr:Radiation-resistant protein [Operophtera brumata]
MNALLDYGSSSNDTDDDSSQEAPKESAKPKLPKPSIGENALHCSVFSNPFVEAELAKAAILEKHVKMVPGKEGTQMINGKKICWNYRKGRCRFGHNCKYAHDSDIQKTQDEMDLDKKKLKTVVCESAGSVLSAPSPPAEEETISTDDSQWESSGPMKKKRPGLSQNLIPGKKVLNIYKKLKLKDAKKSK